ncbi:class I SAM-dependent methyltransferase [Candidatus Methylospira mobilis]|uniref:Class I SAM-dependent methyltransferase n=1 Tax=Candidatus Methylospira mobilis TaxID=1808979 RepID=A0A5Q0BH09_9GAMM|nr:class I SAM-dependent methyltransferase [Candidatus Methylospira mobilis]QFY42422.1 class I SAM-dependent methyltransferase [Candidatus Methylospira mobilis]WNV04476.1 class I SAM-dependent methyltransferase [Candidatus Methylospira mobilis]
MRYNNPLSSLLTALFIQTLCTGMFAFAYVLLPYAFRIQLTLLHMVLLLGTQAFALSRLARMPYQWQVFQLFFPVALLAGFALQWPAIIAPTVFFVLLGVFWPVLKGGAPLFSSGKSAWDAVAQVITPTNDSNFRFLDAGSGTGGLIIALASLHPDATMEGAETACIPWMISRIRIALRRSNARARYINYQHIDFGYYDVVFTYLSPACMPDIWFKARKEMRTHSLLLSYEFAIPEAEPDFRCYPVPGGPPLLGWRIPPANYCC